MMPLVGLGLASLLRERELHALFGRSCRPRDFSLRPKDEPPPRSYRAALFTAIALFGGLPYFEELWRSAHAVGVSVVALARDSVGRE